MSGSARRRTRRSLRTRFPDQPFTMGAIYGADRTVNFRQALEVRARGCAGRGLLLTGTAARIGLAYHESQAILFCDYGFHKMTR
jgi:hypothetical protein